jgi:hypothetical protein
MGSMSGSSRINHINDYDAIEQPDGSWLHDDGDVYWYYVKYIETMDPLF